MLLAAGAAIMGMGRILSAAAALWAVGDVSAKAAKTMALAVIEIIDLFLVATVAYIAAVGIYKLFISATPIELPIRLKINSLKDLEDKIIGVIVAALAVAFLGRAAGPINPEGLLNYGGGIAVVIASLAYFMRQAGEESPP